MKYLIALLLIPMQLFSCDCGLEGIFLNKKVEFFEKARKMEQNLDIYFIDNPIPKEMMPYYKLGAMNAYYDCFISMGRITRDYDDGQ
jgi:hypothetical protein